MRNLMARASLNPGFSFKIGHAPRTAHQVQCGAKMHPEADRVNIAAMVAAADCWSRDRLQLLEWLRRMAPSLAEVYEGAVIMIYAVRLPGRIRFIAHAVREVANRLPEIISGVRDRTRFEVTNQLDAIAELCTKKGFSFDGHLNATPPRSEISVPAELVEGLGRLIRGHLEGRERATARAHRLFASLLPATPEAVERLAPVEDQWRQIIGWFMSRVHDSGQTDAQCDEKELRHKFEIFEKSIVALIREFFTTTVEIDEILEDANS